MSASNPNRSPPGQTRIASGVRPRGSSVRAWCWTACCGAAIPLIACSLITPLDFVGDADPSGKIDAGRDSSGGTGPSASKPDASKLDASEPDAGDACGNSCVNGQVCKGGLCTCPATTIACDGSCIASLDAAGYCGQCGVACRNDQTCVGGTCICGATETNCSDACADLTSDRKHCGTCENACTSGQLCIEGTCRSSPCDGLCANPEALPEGIGGFRVEPLGETAHCIAVSGYLPTSTTARLVCWNFDESRSLSINGKPLPCLKDPGQALTPQKEVGWYCIQIGVGGVESAGLLLPTN